MNKNYLFLVSYDKILRFFDVNSSRNCSLFKLPEKCYKIKKLLTYAYMSFSPELMNAKNKKKNSGCQDNYPNS